MFEIIGKNSLLLSFYSLDMTLYTKYILDFSSASRSGTLCLCLFSERSSFCSLTDLASVL
jgi:hypothetical protein